MNSRASIKAGEKARATQETIASQINNGNREATMLSQLPPPRGARTATQGATTPQGGRPINVPAGSGLAHGSADPDFVPSSAYINKAANRSSNTEPTARVANSTRRGLTARQRQSFDADENIDPRLRDTGETRRGRASRQDFNHLVGAGADNKAALGKNRKAREENENEDEEDETDVQDAAFDATWDGENETDDRVAHRNLQEANDMRLMPAQTNTKQPRSAKTGGPKRPRATAQDDGPPAKRKRATTYRTIKKKRAQAAEKARQLGDQPAMGTQQGVVHQSQVAQPNVASSGFFAYQRQQQLAARVDLRPGIFAPPYSVQTFLVTPMRVGWNWCPAPAPLAQYHIGIPDPNAPDSDPMVVMANSMAVYRSPYPPHPRHTRPLQPAQPAASTRVQRAPIQDLSRGQAIQGPPQPAGPAVARPRSILPPPNRIHRSHGRNVHWDLSVTDSRPRSGRYASCNSRADRTKDNETLDEDEEEDEDVVMWEVEGEDEDDSLPDDETQLSDDEKPFSEDLLPLDEDLADIPTMSEDEQLDPLPTTSRESFPVPSPAPVATPDPTFSAASPSAPVPSGAVVPNMIMIRSLFYRTNGPYPGPIQLPVVAPLNALAHFLMFDPVPSVEFNRALGQYGRLLLWSTADTAAEATLRKFVSWMQVFDRNKAAMKAAGRGVTELWETRAEEPAVIIDEVHVSESTNWYEQKEFEKACWKYCLDNGVDRTYAIIEL